LKDEIISTTATKRFDDTNTGETTKQQVTERGECNRPGTTLDVLTSLAPVKEPEGFITAGNDS
jgi:hypothetical protein